SASGQPQTLQGIPESKGFVMDDERLEKYRPVGSSVLYPTISNEMLEPYPAIVRGQRTSGLFPPVGNPRRSREYLNQKVL
ncbi:hypothetical protein VS877_22320, partial [Salmonella enterica subsp. enterica serovar Paratyphi A]|nr:hypothetical protein [Salmonella enterica subsp. enterica serovar Paratyphi A]